MKWNWKIWKMKIRLLLNGEIMNWNPIDIYGEMEE